MRAVCISMFTDAECEIYNYIKPLNTLVRTGIAPFHFHFAFDTTSVMPKAYQTRTIGHVHLSAMSAVILF